MSHPQYPLDQLFQGQVTNSLASWMMLVLCCEAMAAMKLLECEGVRPRLSVSLSLRLSISTSMSISISFIMMSESVSMIVIIVDDDSWSVITDHSETPWGTLNPSMTTVTTVIDYCTNDVEVQMRTTASTWQLAVSGWLAVVSSSHLALSHLAFSIT